VKKLLFSLFFVFGLNLSLHAEPAVPPYSWTIALVGSDQYYIDHPDSDPRGYENTVGKTRTDGNHGGHVIFYVVVDGGYAYNTSVTWDGSVMTPIYHPIDMDGDTITDRWVLEFEKFNVTEGNIQVKDFSKPSDAYKTVQDYLYVK